MPIAGPRRALGARESGRRYLGPSGTLKPARTSLNAKSGVFPIWNRMPPLTITILNYNRVGSSTLPKFEECLERLEKIVAELEKGEVSLDRALELFDEGMKLSGSCRKELEEAEGKVEVLLKRNGKLQPEAFEATAQA